MRLIDADALCEILEKRSKALAGINGDIGGAVSGAAKLVLAQSPVDAVEVVRCRDCKWRDDQKGATKWMPCRALVTPNDFYCASGEQNDGDGNG